MEGEQSILEGIEALRDEVAPLAQAARSMESLRRDLAPRVEEAVRALIVELSEVESDFQLEDLLALAKKSLRNVKTASRALDQLGSLLALVDNLEPLVRQSVPVWIATLDELERKGVFTVLKAFMGVLEKLGAENGEEDLSRMCDGLATLMGLARSLGDPAAAGLVSRLASTPARIRPEKVGETGARAMFSTLKDPDTLRGLRLSLELTRAMGQAWREQAPKA